MQSTTVDPFTYEESPLDIQREIMSQMDDISLKRFCVSGRAPLTLCNDQTFWINKIRGAGLDPLLPFRSFYSSLASFYFNIRHDAYYVVAEKSAKSLDCHIACSDIEIAWKAAITLVQPHPEQLPIVDQAGQLTMITVGNNPPGDYVIVVLIKNQQVDDRLITNHYVIWSPDPLDKEYNNPKILTYPNLVPKQLAFKNLVIIEDTITSTTVRDLANATLLSIASNNNTSAIYRVSLINNYSFINLMLYKSAFWGRVGYQNIVIVQNDGIYKFAVLDMRITSFVRLLNDDLLLKFLKRHIIALANNNLQDITELSDYLSWQ